MASTENIPEKEEETSGNMAGHNSASPLTKVPVCPSHALVRSKIAEFVSPFKDSTRIKYVCLSANEHLVALGTNTGVVYVYSREQKRCIHVIVAETEGSIVEVSLNAEGNMLAYATSKGHVLVTKLHLVTGGKPERVRCTSDHYGSLVTSLQWTRGGGSLYVGDERGKVSRINFYIPASNKTRTSLRPMSEVIVNLESPVVQIDTFHETHAVISTRTKTFLCYTAKQQFSQIGKKSRDGYFGACFFPAVGSDEDSFIVYCSRPGSRVWEVGMEGDVLSTHQFKQLLNIPPTSCIDSCDYDVSDLFCTGEADGPHSLQFPLLRICCDKYLLTCTNSGLYLLNPSDEGVILWTKNRTDIIDFCCHKNVIFLLDGSGDVQQLEVLNLGELVIRTYSLQLWKSCVTLLLRSPPHVTKHELTRYVTKTMIIDVMNNVEAEYADDLRRFTDSFDFINEVNTTSDKQKTPSEIDVVAGEKCSIPESAICDISYDDNSDVIASISNGQSGADASHIIPVVNSFISCPDGLNEKEKCQDSMQQFTQEVSFTNSSSQPSPATDISPWTPTGGQSAGSEFSVDSGILLHQQSVEDNFDNNGEQMPEIRRRGSLTSLNSLTSLSSSELTFAGTEIDQEPVYLVRHDEKRRSKKVKPSIVALEPGSDRNTNKLPGSRRIKRQKSLNSKYSNSKNAEKHPDEQDGTLRMEVAIESSKSSLEKPGLTSPESTAVMKDHKLTFPQEHSDISMTRDHPFDDSTNVAMETEEESVLESSQETLSTSGGNNRRMKLWAVRDRISSKVKTTTKSVIKNIKDKKTQITERVRRTTAKEDVVEETEKEENVRTVELSALIQATNSASERLEDVTVLYDPTATGHVLDAWVRVLHQTLYELRSDVMNAQEETSKGGNENKEESNRVDESEFESDGTFSCSKRTPRQISEDEDKRGTNIQSEDEVASNSKCEIEESQESEVTESTTDNIHIRRNSFDENIAIDIECEDINHSTVKHEPEFEKSEIICAIQEKKDDDVDSNIIYRNTDRIKHFQRECYLTDPFGLPRETLEKCSNLAQLCFSIVYPGDMSLIFAHHGKSPSSANNTTSQEGSDLSENAHEHQVCSGAGFNGGSLEEAPQERKENHDMHSSHFLRCYFFLFLDNMDAVDLTIKHHLGDRALLWKALVDSLMDLTCDDVITGYIMDQEVDVAMDILRSKMVQHKLRVRAYLLRLYGIVPIHTLEFCAEMYRFIDILDVYFIVKLGSKLKQHFIHYLRKLLDKNNNIDWKETLQKIFRDQELRHVVITCLLECTPPKSLPLNCICGQPRPGAHLVTWPEESLLKHIVEMGHASSSERQIYARHGYWRGYLRLCKRHEDFTVLQRLVLHLDDIRLIDRDSDTGYYPTSPDEWEEIIRIRCHQLLESSIQTQTKVHPHLLCLKCGSNLYSIAYTHQNDVPGVVDKTFGNCYLKEKEQCLNSVYHSPEQVQCRINEGCRITVETLAFMMVRDVGVKQGLEILQHLRIPEGHLPMTFFTSCISGAFIQTQQNCITHQMMERIDTYTWSIKSPMLPPQVAAAVRQEKLEKGDLSNVQTTLTEKMFGSLRLGQPLGSTLEDQGIHWGVIIDTYKPCGGCGCLLRTPVSLHQSGCVVFKCGHCFHRACSSFDFCLLCSTRRKHPSTYRADI